MSFKAQIYNNSFDICKFIFASSKIKCLINISKNAQRVFGFFKATPCIKSKPNSAKPASNIRLAVICVLALSFLEYRKNANQTEAVCPSGTPSVAR